MDSITSAQNSKIKQVRALLTHSKARRRDQRMVLEGVRLVADVMSQGFSPDYILHRADQSPPHADSIAVDPKIFDDLSDTENSQGVLAVFPIPHLELPTDATHLLALDGVRDPGNMGTIIRTATAAGLDGVLLLPHCVDPYNPKAIRAGMGTHFRCPLPSLDWHAFQQRYADWQVVAADVQANTPYHDVDWQQPTVIVIGNEGHGLSDQAQQHITQSVIIPMQNGVESLNTAIAAALLCYEAKR